MPTQEIIVQGLRTKGNHGLTPEERAVPQEFEVDIVTECAGTTPQETDSISDTVDYVAICSIAEAVVRQTSFTLIEKLAAEIADSVLELGGVRRVAVTVKKLAPPMSYRVAYTAARVLRERNP